MLPDERALAKGGWHTLRRLVVAISLVGASAASMVGQPTLVTASEPPSYTVQNNVTYCTPQGMPLRADVYTPIRQAATMPLVLYVHGGGWSGGDKTNVLDPAEAPTLLALTEAGYVVAAIDYRLGPAYHFPVEIEDVKCAVRYFRSFAAQYHVDPTRIAAWGDSAGGQLVSLLGTTDASQGWDVGQYLGVSSRVEAVVDWFGPEDLPTMPLTPAVQAAFASAFGPSYTTAELQLYSPITYVTPDDPPFLLQHGVDDTVVPFSQSQEMMAALVTAGIDAELVSVQNAGHEFTPASPPLPIIPSLDQIGQQVVSFLDRTVKNNPNPRPQ